MLIPDLNRLLREADRDRLIAAVRAAVDTAGWYSPAPEPDPGGTDQSITRSAAKAEAAEEVADAIAIALTTSVKAMKSGPPAEDSGPATP